MKNSDVIVVGLGAMGSASLYQLAKRGKKVLGIDQYSPPHTLGSTHGDTRLTRQAIGEYEHYTLLSLRTHELFREIEQETGKNLLQVTGYLAISNDSKDGKPLVNQVAGVFNTTLTAAKKYNIKHELLTAKEIRQRFPQFKVQDNEIGYYEYGGGFLRPEACVEAQLLLAEKHGAVIHRNEKVKYFIEEAKGITVQTDSDQYHAETLVVSAGPWLQELIGQQLGSIFTICKQFSYWYDVSSSYDDFVPGKFPTFIWELQDAPYAIYGFPAIDGPNGGLKIGNEEYETTVSPDTINREVTAEKINFTFETQVAPFVPKLGKCISANVCLCTMTPDSGFIIDRHPEMPSVIICSPCSGHGFKHSAAIGECVAQLATEGKTKIDISSFRFDRLTAARQC